MDTAAQTTSDESPPYRPHVGPALQYIRDIVLGVNDGLVSLFLLVAGVVGAGFTSRQVFLSAVAASIAGAISMATGEYIATKSQEETFERELLLEREHLKFHREVEVQEIRDMFGGMGLPAAEVQHIVEALDRDDETFLKVMMALEFGVVDEQRRSPYKAMMASGGLFLVGSLSSILPFFFIDRPGIALVVAGVFTSIGLFAVGAVKTRVTATNLFTSGMENLLFGVAGALLSYAVGVLFDATV
jgi:VIT1/CCC1 family predicted Fe2+/Mn2+ transporter